MLALYLFFLHSNRIYFSFSLSLPVSLSLSLYLSISLSLSLSLYIYIYIYIYILSLSLSLSLLLFHLLLCKLRIIIFFFNNITHSSAFASFFIIHRFNHIFDNPKWLMHIQSSFFKLSLMSIFYRPNQLFIVFHFRVPFIFFFKRLNIPVSIFLISRILHLFIQIASPWCK